MFVVTELAHQLVSFTTGAHYKVLNLALPNWCRDLLNIYFFSLLLIGVHGNGAIFYSSNLKQ